MIITKVEIMPPTKTEKKHISEMLGSEIGNAFDRILSSYYKPEFGSYRRWLSQIEAHVIASLATYQDPHTRAQDCNNKAL